ncbi:hypothetical protein [Geodermatophilus poikilotrophus]|nr:hypothetical protein [Geodermatophilus poikilotrophus]
MIYSIVRLREALSCTRPFDVPGGLADSRVPNFPALRCWPGG